MALAAFSLAAIAAAPQTSGSQAARAFPDPSAIDANAYDKNYRTIAVYLIALDSNGFMLDSAKGSHRDAAPKHLIGLSDLQPGPH